MALHLLFTPERLVSCIAACRQSDAVLVMTEGFGEEAIEALMSKSPCPLYQLTETPDPIDSDTSGPRPISDAQWVELTTQHQQIISWHGRG